MKIKIGILGSGVVAQSLGNGFMKHGYDVMLGTRDVSKLAGWVTASGGRTGSFSEAASFGDILVLAVKGSVAAEVLDQAGPSNFGGKIMIDTTNPIADLPTVNGVLRFTTTLDESLMEQLQRRFPSARFVKAFNSVGNSLMVNPDFGGIRPTMFTCGNDEAARQAVATILDQFGWETSDMGTAEAARAIEPLCILWCIPGFLRNDWKHAFKLLR